MTSEASVQRRSRGAVLFALATFGFIALGVIALVVPFWRTSHPAGLGLIAVAPYLMLAPVVALVIALVRRKWLAAALALAVTIGCAAAQAPHYRSDPAPENAVEVVALTINARSGKADAAEIVRAVREHDVDLLMVQELNYKGLSDLTGAGLDKVMPYNVGKPGWGPDGTGLWSRHPLYNGRMQPGFSFVTVAARVGVPGVKQGVFALAIHPAGPIQARNFWLHDIATLPAMLKVVPPGAVIVGGDFNATPNNFWFRRILSTTGYANGIDQAGRGLIPTYSAEHPVPLIAIDHVLTRGAVATSVEPVSISGSDHRGIVATIAVPRGAQP